MDKQFEPLASGEVLSVDRSVQILLGQTTFRASELAAALKSVVLAKTQGSPAQADWFSDRGVPCEALRFGARGWQRGRVRISLEFHPDSDELQPDARASEASEWAIAPPPTAPAPASDDSEDWLEPVEMPAGEPSAAIPEAVEDEGELELATEASAPDIEPDEIEDVFEDAPPPPFEPIDDSDEELEDSLTADSDVDDIFAHAPEPERGDLGESAAELVDEASELVEGDSFFEEASADEPAEVAADEESDLLGESAADESAADALFADEATEELSGGAEDDEGDDIFGTTEEDEDLFGAAEAPVAAGEDIFGAAGEAEASKDLFGEVEESAAAGEDIFAADETGDDDPFGMAEDEGNDELFGAIADETGDSNEAGFFGEDEDDLFGLSETEDAADLGLALESDGGAIALGGADDELVAGDEDDRFGDSDELSLELGDDLDDAASMSNGKEEKDVFEDIWQDIDDLPSN